MEYLLFESFEHIEAGLLLYKRSYSIVVTRCYAGDKTAL